MTTPEAWGRRAPSGPPGVRLRRPRGKATSVPDTSMRPRQRCSPSATLREQEQEQEQRRLPPDTRNRKKKVLPLQTKKCRRCQSIKE